MGYSNSVNMNNWCVQEAAMHSLSNSLFSQESYWRGGVASPYSSLQPLGTMTPNSYNPYDQYSSHPAVTSR